MEWITGSYNVHYLRFPPLLELSLDYRSTGYIMAVNGKYINNYPLTTDLATAKRLAENWLKSNVYALAMELEPKEFTLRW